MDWTLLAIAIALLVVAVYSGISYFREKKQSVVYLGVGDSALFTIIPSYAHRENALRAFFRPEPQKSPSSHRKPPGIALINFT
ncbi:TPA: small membrane protein, partial [Enterococcus faecium]|nr:small membrane protein [Enterococcus faecium]